MTVLYIVLGVLGLLAVVLLVLWFVFPARMVDLLIGIERAVVGVKRHELNAGGFRMVYWDSGGDREPLVLVHGFGGEKDNWNRLARFLVKDYRLIALDLPGFGESDAPLDASYCIPDQVTRLHAFIEALGLQRPHIAGHSMGGFISASYAATYPQEISSLWLISSAGMFNSTPSELLSQVKQGGPNPLLVQTHQEMRDLLPFIMSRSPPLPSVLIDVLATRAIAAHGLRTRQFVDVIEKSPHLEELLVDCKVPTHIVWGDEDRLVHVDCVKSFTGMLCNSSSTIVPGVGHVPPFEAPAEIAADYLAFRKRVAALAPA